MDTLTSERRKLQEWVNEKDNEDLVSTALIEYADFCKKVINNPNKYLACKKEILERLEASGQNEAEASDVHVNATVTPFGESKNQQPFTMEWWMGVEYKARKEAESADKWMSVYAKEGKDEDAEYYYREADKYYAIWRFSRKRMLQKYYAKKV